MGGKQITIKRRQFDNKDKVRADFYFNKFDMYPIPNINFEPNNLWFKKQRV